MTQLHDLRSAIATAVSALDALKLVVPADLSGLIAMAERALQRALTILEQEKHE